MLPVHLLVFLVLPGHLLAFISIQPLSAFGHPIGLYLAPIGLWPAPIYPKSTEARLFGQKKNARPWASIAYPGRALI